MKRPRPHRLGAVSERDIKLAKEGDKSAIVRVRRQTQRIEKRLREIEDWDRDHAAERGGSGIGDYAGRGVEDAAQSGVGDAAQSAAHSEQDTALIADGAPQIAECGVTEGSGIEDSVDSADGESGDAGSVMGDLTADRIGDSADEVDGLTDDLAHMLDLGRDHHHRRRPYSASRRYVRISVQSTLCRSIVSCATPKHIGLR